MPRKPARQLTQEFGPDRLGLRGGDLHAQHLAATVAVDTNGDDHGNGDDAAAAADLQVGGIDPQIRPVALDRKLRDRDDPILAVSTLGPHQSSRSAPVTMISCDGLI